MSGHEGQSAPSPDEAFAVLQQLASSFLQGRARSPADTATDAASADFRRPGIVVLDGEGMIQAIDVESERLLARVAVDVIGSAAAALFGKLPTGGGPVLRHFHGQDGTEHSVWVTSTKVTLGSTTHVVLTLHGQDLGGRRTELRYRHLVEQIPAVVFTAALDGGLYDIYISPQIESLLGYSQVQWLADPVLWYERLHPDDRRKLDEEFARGCITGGPFRADCRFLTRDDRVVWVHGEARLIKDAQGLPVLLQGVAFDITETKHAEEIARASLREKETLLKEIHHRVKNNLQVTSSLLKLQAERIEDESAKRALREGQGRIRSMALVHELLYRSKDLSRVDLGQYVRDLSRQLLRSHVSEPSNIRIESNLVPVPLPIDLAVPCGLVLNELVSNALKHAFPGGRRGTVYIELQPGEDFHDLVVRDDGVGMPAGIDFHTGSTLGLRLVRTLADQIEGKLLVRGNGGTEVRLRIPSGRETRG